MSTEEKAGDLSIVSDSGLTEVPEDFKDLMGSLKQKIAVFTKSCEDSGEYYGVKVGITVKFTLERVNNKGA